MPEKMMNHPAQISCPSAADTMAQIPKKRLAMVKAEGRMITPRRSFGLPSGPRIDGVTIG
jgi:hypothetical protein